MSAPPSWERAENLRGPNGRVGAASRHGAFRLAALALIVAVPTHPAAAQGQAFGWGSNASGQVSPPVGSMLPYRSVDVGGFHTMAIRLDGTVAAWGRNEWGQSDVPAALGPSIAIAAGTEHSVAVRLDGTVVCWGRNVSGECAVPAGLLPVAWVDASAGWTAAVQVDGAVRIWGADFTHGVPGGLEPVRRLRCGGAHVVALTTDGQVRAWGSNEYGQCTVPASVGQAHDVAAGFASSMALRPDGTVVAWGDGSTGFLAPPEGLLALEVVMGNAHAVARRLDGSIVAWGSAMDGATSPPASASIAASLSAAGSQSASIGPDGRIALWGSNQYSQSTVAQDALAIVELDLGGAGGIGFEGHAIARNASGAVMCWGSNAFGQCMVPGGLASARDVSAGATHSLVATQLGSVVAWGNDASGQSTVPSDLPAGIVEVEAGGEHSVARTEGGSVHCWGSNIVGQCSVPGDLPPAVRIAAGYAHTLAVDADGSVHCWGNPADGACLPPPGMGPVDAVAAGGNPFGSSHSLAALRDGTVVAWGSNQAGQCTVPDGLAGVVSVAAGSMHSLALREDGSVVAWGYSASGEATVPRSLGGVAEVTAGAYSSMAVLSAGISSCASSGGSGIATAVRSGQPWDIISTWDWSTGATVQVPGPSTTVVIPASTSVGLRCGGRCASVLSASAATIVLTPALAGGPRIDEPLLQADVAAQLGGRLWLAASDVAQLPMGLDIALVQAPAINASFDVIQTQVPPPEGMFPTVERVVSGGVVTLRLRLAALAGNGQVASQAETSVDGSIVAASAIDWNADGFDDLAVLFDQGPKVPGRLQVILNDGLGALGASSVQVLTEPQPTCLAVGDLDADGIDDVTVGTVGALRVQAYLSRPAGGSPFVVGVALQPGAVPTAVAIVPASGAGLLDGAPVIAVGSSGSTGGSITLFDLQARDPNARPQVITVPVAPTTVVNRGRKVTTGGASSTTLGGSPDTGAVCVIDVPVDGTARIAACRPISGVPVAMDVGDLDGDGWDDVVCANAEPRSGGIGTPLPVLAVLRGTASGLGEATPVAPAGASSARDVDLVDIDDDGDPDVVCVVQVDALQSDAIVLRTDRGAAGGAITLGAITARTPGADLIVRADLDGGSGDDAALVGRNGLSSFGAQTPITTWLGSGSTCRGDLNDDAAVTGDDVALLLASWGSTGSPNDLSGNGTVDGADLAILLNDWGPCAGR